MPVLTYELTFGTKTLLTLNISHNMVNEIRKSVLGNLTSLQVLDLSHNLIEDLTAPNVFVLPLNLTFLSLAQNSLHTFPVKPVLKAHTLKHLDLRFNELESFYNELMLKVKNGTNIYYEGNPVSCDCRLRPVRRWALSLIEPDGVWSEFRCQDPPESANTSIIDLPEEFLLCNTTEEDEVEDFQLTPDVKFRHFQKSRDGGLRVTWFVNTKMDVADFRLTVKEQQNNDSATPRMPLWEKHEPYNTRSDILYTLPRNQGDLELCVEIVTSEGVIKPPLSSQCLDLPYLNSAATRLPCWLLVLSLVHIVCLL